MTAKIPYIVLDDGVYIDALNLLVRIQNQIKGIATIDNPKFYEMKRLGKSNYYNFRQISLWEESEGYIRLPRGILENIEEKCRSAGIKCDIIDKRQFGRPIRDSVIGTLQAENWKEIVISMC